MLCHLRHWVLGFHFPVYWYLDPFRDTTDEDSKYLHNALQIRVLSPPLSHLILSMTLSGRKGRLCWFFLFLAACRILIPHALLVAQSCLTLCDPMDCSLPGSSVHRIFQAKMLEWVAISFSSRSSQARDQTLVSCISWNGRQFFYQLSHWESPFSSGFLPSHWFPLPGSSPSRIQGYPQDGQRRWMNNTGRPSFGEQGP